jgi:hypothetical protein
MSTESFLIDIQQSPSGEWVANFSDGTLVLNANNYHDAVLEADCLIAENTEQWDSLEQEYDEFVLEQKYGDFYYE